MQADEDVGKVAQATPIVVCKHLKLSLKMVFNTHFEITIS